MNYSNIKLVPRHLSTVNSRDDVSLAVPIGRTKLSMPILISPMNTVAGLEMSKLFNKNGLFGCLPRQGDWNSSIDTYASISSSCIISIGLDDFSIAEDFYNYGNSRYFLVDTANGYNTNVKSIIRQLTQLEDVFIIAGNVASREGYEYMANLGVNGVRVGIGVGSICETTVNTGIGQSLVDSVQECYAASLSMLNPPLIIADGGMKTVGDIAKILALGADLVMLGSLFAGTKESPGKVILQNGEKFKLYHGSASYASQAEYKDTVTYVEGTEILTKYIGSAQKTIDRIDAGLRSSLSYMNAKTLEEFRENCQSGNCIKFV